MKMSCQTQPNCLGQATVEQSLLNYLEAQSKDLITSCTLSDYRTIASIFVSIFALSHVLSIFGAQGRAQLWRCLCCAGPFQHFSSAKKHADHFRNLLFFIQFLTLISIQFKNKMKNNFDQSYARPIMAKNHPQKVLLSAIFSDTSQRKRKENWASHFPPQKFTPWHKKWWKVRCCGRFVPEFFTLSNHVMVWSWKKNQQRETPRSHKVTTN
jgi:hypothetical protein